MSLLDSVMQNVGTQAFEKIGARFGLPAATVQQAAQVILPALAGGLLHHAQAGALPTPANGAAPGSDEARAHGNEVLGTVLGSRDASRSLASQASAKTGIDVGTVERLLPQLASVAARTTSHATENGSLGGLVSSLGGMLRE